MERSAIGLGVTHVGGKAFLWGERTFVMGVLNITPDSFSGDGLAGDLEAAVAQALAFQEAGADIIDVGGESTRPPGPVFGAGAAPVSVEEELARVIPVIQRLRDLLRIPISIDTYKSEVARQAIAAGAALINDVWAMERDPAIAQAAAEASVPLVLMHNQNGTTYKDLLSDVTTALGHRMEQAMAAGVPLERIIVDPGIGFGKTAEQNLELLRRLREFKAALSRPVLVGTSRKSTLGLVLGGLPPEERLEGTTATVALAIAQGADMVRVHDVPEMIRVARMSDAIVRGWSPHQP